MISKKDNTIHVVHIIPTLNFGGAEKFVVELTKHIHGDDVKQTIITFWDERPLMNELQDRVACELMSFFDIPYWRRIAVLSGRLQELGADVVHTHLFSADLWGRLAARRAGIPVVTTEHNINTQESRLWTAIKRWMNNYSAVYTAPSEAVASFMKKIYHIPSRSIEVIRHGIDVDMFAVVKNPKWKEPYRIGMIGRLSEQKGHTIAIDAMNKLTDVDAKLIITGAGELKDELYQYAQEKRLNARIEWHDPVTDVASVYADCDIVIVPSLWEGLGLVVLEAMASGRCVIGSDVDGIAEIVADGVTGHLVPVGDADALANMIRRALTHREETDTISRQARTLAQENVRIEDMADAYKKIYIQLTTV